MKNQYGVDIEEVVENARREGIDPSEITLVYEGLTASEALKLVEAKLISHQTQRCVLGKLMEAGKAAFAEKISSVYSLGA